MQAECCVSDGIAAGSGMWKGEVKMNRKSFVLGVCLALIPGTAGLAVQAGAAPYSKG